MYKNYLTVIAKIFQVLFFFIFSNQIIAQTTDLSIVAQAQSASGMSISQVDIFGNFEYKITILNSGNAVNNATFEITMDSDLQNVALANIMSQNNTGGASNAVGLNLTTTNVLTGVIESLPSDSSVDIIVEVTAPSSIGGIAINAIIFPPQGISDTNTSNNQSLISIDVIDVDINFSITHEQISPEQGTPLLSWDSPITYQITITNNSTIDFAIDNIKAQLSLLTPLDFGRPYVQFISLECIETTNNTICPNTEVISENSNFVSATAYIWDYNQPHIYTAGGSITYEVVYQYLEPSCAIELNQINVESRVEIILDHVNSGNNLSNPIVSNLLESELCETTDVCIDTLQIDPDPLITANWDQDIIFETTVCNNGPLDANIAFFLQNLAPTIEWDIISVECIGTTGTISCDAFNFNINDIFWVTDTFLLPVDATITVRTTAIFTEPDCSPNTNENQVLIRSGVNLLEADILDANTANNAQNDYVLLPPTSACDNVDLSVTKTQTTPELPNGASIDNPIALGEITYEITVENPSDIDTFIELQDYVPSSEAIPYTAVLTAVNCVSTTGTATCFDISNANIGVEFDGISQLGELDVFWEILPEDNWSLPADSSVTFQLSVLWDTDCSVDPIPVKNIVTVMNANSNIDNFLDNNEAEVITFVAPCVDLIVQTFPEFTQVNVNQSFDWIIDITNSENSSNATTISFENTINEVFTITGAPSCIITNGNATCITNLDVADNLVSGIIPNMEAGSTIQIRVPVTAPSFGGAFNNTAVATPNENENREISPETNTSISNIQVVAPSLAKTYAPEIITIGEQSTLTFTITNLADNPSQSDISFTDVFSSEITLTEAPQWVSQNGCSGSFVGSTGDNFAGVTDLIFPEGTDFCTFSVEVTSNTPGTYLNDTTNFENQNNIDTSQTNATLTVLDDDSDVDIEIIKTAFPEEASIGDEVVFQITATNLGSTEATSIKVLDAFPSGLNLLSASTTMGIFNETTFEWDIDSLSNNQSETLTIVTQIISSTNIINIASLTFVNEPDRDSTNNSDQAEIQIDNCLFITNGLSPNNDGFNDTFHIECIEEFPGNTIKIYNRYGVQIYENTNYQNDWAGLPNMGTPKTSELLPTGTYYYIIDLNTGDEPIIDWLYLNY